MRQPPAGDPTQPTRPKRRRRVLVVVAVGIAAVVVALGVRIGAQVVREVGSACGDKGIQHELSASDVPTGFRTVTGDGAGHGLTLAAPQALRSFTLTQEHLDQVSSQPPHDPGEAGALAEAKELFAHRGVLLLVDYETGNNISVIRTPEPTRCRLPHGMATEAEKELRAEGATIRSTTDVRVGGRAGVKVNYVISDGSGGTINGVQVYVAGRDAVYLLTVSSYTLSPRVADAITTSLRIP